MRFRALLNRLRTRQVLTSIADVVGLVVVSVGTALIYLPAGVIVAGLGVLAVSYIEAGA